MEVFINEGNSSCEVGERKMNTKAQILSREK